MTNLDVTDFTSVDQTSDPAFFSRFLTAANQNADIIASKQIILDGLRLEAGQRVLDVGCGTGADVFDMAGRVGRTGHATGVDMSESLIDIAKQSAGDLDLAVSFEVGDVQNLRFEDGSFDAVRTERLLMHVPDADRALWEMVRVVRAGGRISVFDFDWETLFIDSPNKDVTRRIALSFCDGIKNGWIGRRLPRMFRQSGIVDPSVTYRTVNIDLDFLQLLIGGHVTRAVAAGTISADEADAWWTDLARINREGSFLCGFLAFIVSGSKG